MTTEPWSDEAKRVGRFLSSAGPLANTTVENAVADEIMMQTGGNTFGAGVLYNIKSQQVSPGVCRLTLGRAN